jgi:CheY-like chemotaxis protein
MAKILIIDDSSYMRSKVREALKHCECIFLEADNGFKGLQIIREQSPDCVILDLIMPDIDGTKILKILHDENSKTPVVVVTADIQEIVRKECLELGAKAFVNKPIKEDELSDIVEDILGFQ